MAYLSEDEITGTVNINIHASDDGKIINSTKSGQIISKLISGTNSGLCTNCTKFRKYSIASTEFEIRPNTDERNDFTLCAWVYPVKYDDTDFTMIDYGTGRGFNFAFIESNNGLYGNGDKIVVAVDYEKHIMLEGLHLIHGDIMLLPKKEILFISLKMAK